VLEEHLERLDAVLRLEDSEFLPEQTAGVFSGVCLVIHEKDGVGLVVIGADLGADGGWRKL
jgi:hypothetical protein